MKVIILTFHRPLNYGAILQATSLFRFLKETGHEVEILNYALPTVPIYSPWRNWGIRDGRVFRLLVPKLKLISKRLKFDRFLKKQVVLSPLFKSIECAKDYVSRFDMIVVGSDQVWNPELTDAGGTYPYFLDFLESNNELLKYSYAACCGNPSTKYEHPEKMSSLLKRFSKVSVRNDFSAKIIEPLLSFRPSVVPDPTLLIDEEEDFSDVELAEQRVTIFSLIPNAQKELQALADKIAVSLGTGVREIVSDGVALSGISRAPEISLSAQEWQHAIAEANYLVTDSFHGTVYALKYGIPVAVYSPGWRMARIEGLLELVREVTDVEVKCEGDFLLIGSLEKEDRKKLIQHCRKIATGFLELSA